VEIKSSGNTNISIRRKTISIVGKFSTPTVLSSQTLCPPLSLTAKSAMAASSLSLAAFLPRGWSHRSLLTPSIAATVTASSAHPNVMDDNNTLARRGSRGNSAKI